MLSCETFQENCVRERKKMRKSFTGWALAALLAGGFAFPLDAAPAKKKVKSSQAPKPAAAATARTTDINECGKMDAATRDACISSSRPVKGADLYKKWGGGGASAAAPAPPAKAAAAATAQKAAQPAAKKGAGMPKVTTIDECSKMDAAQRDACISRSSPVKGDELYKKYKR